MVVSLFYLPHDLHDDVIICLQVWLVAQKWRKIENMFTSASSMTQMLNVIADGTESVERYEISD